MSKFYENDLSIDTIWRAIILQGANNKTYKFALGKSLIELAQTGNQSITMKDLAPIFAKHTLEHVKKGNKQGVDDKKKGDFLIACEDFSNNKISEGKLYEITEKKAFVDVIERFHTVNRGTTPITFYDTSAFGTEKKIVIKDEIFKLINSVHGDSLTHEIEARWNLVENAWDLELPPQLLEVVYDEITKLFYIRKNEQGKTRRVDVTKARNALNGYQKGHCFFCFDYISVSPKSANLCHVDHFFPHTLFDRANANINYNGAWNLVLSCSECNGAKSAKLPAKKYLDRLHNRNEYYVASHLPLKESILKTGATEPERISFLQKIYDDSNPLLIQKFETPLKQGPRF